LLVARGAVYLPLSDKQSIDTAGFCQTFYTDVAPIPSSEGGGCDGFDRGRTRAQATGESHEISWRVTLMTGGHMGKLLVAP